MRLSRSGSGRVGRRVLHAGCGGSVLPPLFHELFGDDLEEVRLDIDPATKPDIVASITDLGDIGPFHALYSSHNLEHVYPHEVPVALREFRRVLTEDGFVLIFVPDLEGLTVGDEEVLLNVSPVGPATAFDLIYGFRPDVAAHPQTMAHHTGFTSALLKAALFEAGFGKVHTKRMSALNLMAVAGR